MKARYKVFVAGLMYVLAISASPAWAQQCNTGGNCHYNTIRNIAGNVPIPQYRPGYASSQQVVNQLRINVNRGVPLSQVNIQGLTSNHVVGVSNGQGGFDHCAAIVVGPNGQVTIRQAFDTSTNNYQPVFQNGQQFLNQTVRYGPRPRQPYATNTNRVQVFCPGGTCTQHR